MSECLGRPDSWLYFNQESVPCPPTGWTLAGLLAERGVDETSVSTAVNGLFVPRPQRAHKDLVPGDRVLTFQAIVGG